MDNTTRARRKQAQRDYTMGFKLAVVEQVEKGQNLFLVLFWAVLGQSGAGPAMFCKSAVTGIDHEPYY